MTDIDDLGDSEVAISIEGRGPTIVDALADVLLGAQDQLRAVNAATDDEEPER